MDPDNYIIRHSGLEAPKPKKTFNLNQKSIDKLETAIYSLDLLHTKLNPEDDSEVDKEFKSILQLLTEVHEEL